MASDLHCELVQRGRGWLAAMFAPPAWMREQQRREDRALVRALDAAAKEYQQQEGA